MIERDNSVMPTEQEVEQFLIDYHWMHNRIQRIVEYLGKDCDFFIYDPASPSTLDVRWEEYDYEGNIRHDYNLPTHYLYTMDDKILSEEKVKKEEAARKEAERVREWNIQRAFSAMVQAEKRVATAKEDAEKDLRKARETLASLQAQK